MPRPRCFSANSKAEATRETAETTAGRAQAWPCGHKSALGLMPKAFAGTSDAGLVTVLGRPEEAQSIGLAVATQLALKLSAPRVGDTSNHCAVQGSSRHAANCERSEGPPVQPLTPPEWVLMLSS